MAITGRSQFPMDDLAVSATVALANVAAHILWNPIASYAIFLSTALAFTLVLSLFPGKTWGRLSFFITKFYCVAALFDLFSEGLLQPFDHDTIANVICTATMLACFSPIGWSCSRSNRRYFLPREISTQ